MEHTKFGLSLRGWTWIIAASLVVVISAFASQQSDTLAVKSGDPRGYYFSKKSYVESQKTLPTFQASRDALPSPILQNNPEWIEMYWKCWEIAFNHIRKVRPSSPFVSDYLDEAFNDNIFQWDTIFMTMFARYGYRVFPAIQSLDNFYSRQHRSGYICREVSEQTGEDFVYDGRKNTINPPMFSWAEVESFNVTGDKSRFSSVLPVLDKYVEWLNREGNIRTADGKDWENYGRRATGSKHRLYWNTGLGCGMDNTPRGGNGWVDMSCQMIIQYNDLAHMCEELGLTERAKSYKAEAKSISDRINKWCWNEHDGFYYDVDEDGNQVKWKTAGTFWPLIAGVASAAQAERLVQHLRDTTTFWRPFVFPTLAADQKGYNPKGGYWLGGVWAPTNYMIIKGLEKYGYTDFASGATEKYLQGMAEVFRKTGTVWENYAPESFEPGKPAKGDFVGWTGCGPIALLIEDVLGFHCDGVRGRLTWNIRRSDRHGIERLCFGDSKISAVYDPPGVRENSPTITISTDRHIEIVVNRRGKSRIFQVKAGTQRIVLEQSTESRHTSNPSLTSSQGTT
jgi:glycogen debranching enzyme